MTYDQLEMLERILEKGSFKAAAESLNKTQPSISVAIKKLEDEFGITIFNRHSYRPTLTEQGEIFCRWLKQCLRSFKDLESVGKQLGTSEAESRLSVIIDPLAHFPAIESVFKECLAWPNITDLTVKTPVLGGGMDALTKGEADFAIAPKLADLDSIESVFYERVELIPVVASSLVADVRIDTSWLQTHRQILVIQGNETELENPLLKEGINQGPKCFVTDHVANCNLILNGFGWGWLSSRDIQKELSCGVLRRIHSEVASPLELQLHVMRNRYRPMGPVARRVWASFTKQH